MLKLVETKFHTVNFCYLVQEAGATADIRVRQVEVAVPDNVISVWANVKETFRQHTRLHLFPVLVHKRQHIYETPCYRHFFCFLERLQ